jgi:hypothetical protein
MINWWNNLENTTRVRIIQASVMMLFAIAATPFLIGVAIGLQNVSPAFQKFIWIWPVCIVCLGFVAVVSYLVYQTISNR